MGGGPLDAGIDVFPVVNAIGTGNVVTTNRPFFWTLGVVAVDIGGCCGGGGISGGGGPADGVGSICKLVLDDDFGIEAWMDGTTAVSWFIKLSFDSRCVGGTCSTNLKRPFFLVTICCCCCCCCGGGGCVLVVDDMVSTAILIGTELTGSGVIRVALWLGDIGGCGCGCDTLLMA